jgi:hypothetical protein
MPALAHRSFWLRSSRRRRSSIVVNWLMVDSESPQMLHAHSERIYAHSQGGVLLLSSASCAPIVSLMDSMRDRQRTWLKDVLAHRGWNATEWARRARLAPSTLNRFLNDPDYEHELSKKTLRALGEAAGLEPYQIPGVKRPSGFSEPDAQALFESGTSGDAVVDEAVRVLLQGRNGIDPWIMRSRALEFAGYLPGDVLIVDLNERPKAEDAVCAQVYDWTTGKAETVMRLYTPPYLVAMSSETRFLKPFVVDDDVVVIKGVIVSSYRPRRDRSAA